jgi:hypothetical protein
MCIWIKEIKKKENHSFNFIQLNHHPALMVIYAHLSTYMAYTQNLTILSVLLFV